MNGAHSPRPGRTAAAEQPRLEREAVAGFGRHRADVGPRRIVSTCEYQPSATARFGLAQLFHLISTDSIHLGVAHG